jgi:cyanophycinase
MSSQRMVQLAPGLGLIDSVTIDQHFRQRNRMGRLMTAVAFNPAIIGVGIDEDTAFVIDPNAKCEVLGSGGVTIVDGSELEYSDIHFAQCPNPIATIGMHVHTLTQGYTYDLNSRKIYRPEMRIPA